MTHFNEAAPEGAQTVTATGEDVKSAVLAAAEELKVPADAVRYEVDVSYFRNESGGMVPRDDLRIIAWGRDMGEVEVMNDARGWVTTLLGHLEVEAEVSTRLEGPNCRVVLSQVSDAGRLVGRRGRTVQGIEHMLNMAVGPDHEDYTFKVDIADKREREDRDDRRGRERDDRGRDDRGRGRGRGRERDDRRGRDRDDRGRGRDRDDRSRGRGRGDDRDAEKLRRMAEKIIKRVLETGKAERVRKELNGYDRRIIHLAAREVEGVETRSIGDGSYKQIEFYPTDAQSSGEE